MLRKTSYIKKLFFLVYVAYLSIHPRILAANQSRINGKISMQNQGDERGKNECFRYAIKSGNYWKKDMIHNYDDYSKNEEIQSLESRLGLSDSKSIIAIEKTDLYEQPSLENFINEYLSDGYEEEMDTEEFKELPTISVKLAENAIETLETFLMQHKNTPREHYFKLYELKRFIEYENRKDAVQTKITMYFK